MFTQTPEGWYIEFPDTKMGPYSHVFHAENTKYDDELGSRGSSIFPFPPIGGTTEIFLATSQIILGCAKRKTIFFQEKKCLDLIQVSTRHKQRLELDSLELLYNSKIQDQEVLCIYFTHKNTSYLKILNQATLKTISQTPTKIMVRFHTLIEGKSLKNLEFYKNYPYFGNWHLDGYFVLSDGPIDEQKNPNSFTPYQYSWQLVEYTKQFMDYQEESSIFRLRDFCYTPYKDPLDPQTLEFRIRGYLDYNELLRLGKLHYIIKSDYKISRAGGYKIFYSPHFVLKIQSEDEK